MIRGMFNGRSSQGMDVKVHALLAAVLVAAAASAQEPPPPDTVAAGPAPPLLREGGFIMEQTGTLHRKGTDWVFRMQPPPDRPEDPPYDLTLLPCTLLANLEQLVESLPEGTEFPFDLTGEVFVYHDRNYLLPTHAPRLAGYVPTRREDADTPEADSAERILGDLDRAVGPVPRSPGETAASADASGAPQLVPAGTVLLWRRGWMVREADSAWSFVFEADASGESDPPMTLLPCLLLEDMETHAQEQGPRRALVVCGRVFRYHARNYLLPTAFQIARENTVRP